jgi:hypothetical protein
MVMKREREREMEMEREISCCYHTLYNYLIFLFLPK